ncbi:DUF6497 family protein [Pseudooceanicola nanhaiensis]|uniref:DUF6497 family protein n=1 Tax=Pseudooceanicola nanhaiensis TaxID=375761 RepID=UPI00405902E3
MKAIARNFVAAGGALLGAATTAAGQEEPPTVPSGIPLTLQEILLEQGPDAVSMARFRYVAAGLEGFGFAGVEGDFPVLCSDVVLPWAAVQGEPVGRVVISMASAATEFGTAAPDVVQFFEVFRLEPSACIWEGL